MKFGKLIEVKRDGVTRLVDVADANARELRVFFRRQGVNNQGVEWLQGLIAAVARHRCSRGDAVLDDPQFQDFEARVRSDPAAKIHGSALCVALVPASPENVDVKFAVELGLMVMLDKPILAVVTPGSPIPEKLARVVDRFVESDPADPTQQSRIALAIAEMMGQDGSPEEPA